MCTTSEHFFSRSFLYHFSVILVGPSIFLPNSNIKHYHSNPTQHIGFPKSQFFFLSFWIISLSMRMIFHMIMAIPVPNYPSFIDHFSVVLAGMIISPKQMIFHNFKEIPRTAPVSLIPRCRRPRLSSSSSSSYLDDPPPSPTLAPP